jgi:hypothetical protein
MGARARDLLGRELGRHPRERAVWIRVRLERRVVAEQVAGCVLEAAEQPVVGVPVQVIALVPGDLAEGGEEADPELRVLRIAPALLKLPRLAVEDRAQDRAAGELQPAPARTSASVEQIEARPS